MCIRDSYNDGIIKAVLGTNLTYRQPELLEGCV